MSWFIYAITCALSIATADALCKKALANNDSYTIALVRNAYAAPFLLIFLPFIDIPILDGTFFLAVLILIPLDITALLLYIKAIKISPLSLTLPFLSLTPVFSIGTSYIILGERPNKMGLIGITLVAIGAYLLNIHSIKNGIFGPFKEIFKEKGSVLMIIVAFIFSISLIFGKIAVLHSSPIFFCIVFSLLLTFFIFIIACFKTNNISRKIISQPVLFLLIGISIAIMMYTHLKSVSLVEVSYMVSVKRLGLLIGVIYGAVLFKEKNIKERFLGCAIMVLGIILIYYFQQ